MLNDRGGLPDLVIFVATLALLSIGIVMVFSASSVTAYHELGDPLLLSEAPIPLGDNRNCSNDYVYEHRLPCMGEACRPSYGSFTGSACPRSGARGLALSCQGLEDGWESSPFGCSLPNSQSCHWSCSWRRIFRLPQARTKSLRSGFLLPMMIIGACSVLVLKEPDLGTAIGIAGVGWFMLFAGGGSNMASLIATVAAAIPAVYLLQGRTCKAQETDFVS